MANNNIVVVHGVQRGDDEDATKGPKELFGELLKESVGSEAQITGIFPAYEDLNDQLTGNIKGIFSAVLAILQGTVGLILAREVIDLVGDVFIYRDREKARQVRTVVTKAMVKATSSPDGCILVGHSLGSVVCFDIVMDLIRQGDFKDKEPKDWPIKSLVTFGSPLALDIFKNQRKLESFDGKGTFNWFNYSDRNDPMVSAKIFGNEFTSNRLMRNAYGDETNPIHIHDAVVDTGFHLLAHVNYWKQQHIIDRLESLLE